MAEARPAVQRLPCAGLCSHDADGHADRPVHLHTFDRPIGIIGDAGSASFLVSGMFGLELTT